MVTRDEKALARGRRRQRGKEERRRRRERVGGEGRRHMGDFAGEEQTRTPRREQEEARGKTHEFVNASPRLIRKTTGRIRTKTRTVAHGVARGSRKRSGEPTKLYALV